MDVLVLYSWESNKSYAQEWAVALCEELSEYPDIKADCDMLWHPESNVSLSIENKINNADKIIVIVSNDYNKKIESGTGMVSFEETLYKNVIETSAETNKILFVLKDKNISPPSNWENYNRYDLSTANIEDYSLNKGMLRKEIENIILFLTNQPLYKLPSNKEKRKLPKSQIAKNFEELFISKSMNIDNLHEQELTVEEQEKRLTKYIEKNINQRSFVSEYIKSGLADDNNLNERITPEIFIKHFLVKREDNDEKNYKSIIRDLFNSFSYNMLCVQSDGGSGKTVFLKTIAYRYMNDMKNSIYKYNTIFFDFAIINNMSEVKESIIFQKFKKVYRRIMKDSIPGWKKNFVSKLENLKAVSFENSELFNLGEFEEELINAIKRLTPKDDLDNWYIGHSKRVKEMKKEASENVSFILLLTLYLLALESMPNINKENRYIIIFDNIETFDNGDMARKISNFVQKCYSFIKRIYREYLNLDAFYKTFTFVISMRTSTFLPFGNAQTDIWNGERYIKRIQYFDFTIEAIIKKIIFLKKIPNYQNTYLYKTLYNILSLFLQKNYIDQAIDNECSISFQERYFTTYRFLPLFNNNFRRAMELLCGAFTNEQTSEIYDNLLNLIQNKYGQQYDYLINGIRMMIVRYLFEDLHLNTYLNTIGFPELSGEEEYSMTRMILEYLYWNEIRYTLINPRSNYEGVKIKDLIWVFNHFSDEKHIANTLYDLSIYVKRNPVKANALYAWAYLITYKNIDADLTEDDFKQIIKSICNSPNNIIKIKNIELNPNRIKVKLSDAGMCFTQYYLRSLEFLMARNNDEDKQKALFSLTEYDDIAKFIQVVYSIIKNCIEKIIRGGEKVCILYGHEKENCVYKNSSCSFDIMQCSLFIRFQECLDMIKESIDYIDRFRVSHYERNNDKAINNLLLDSILEFYKLYEYVNENIFKYNCSSKLKKFLIIWDGEFNQKCSVLLSGLDNKRIERIRPIKNYYVYKDERFGDIVCQLKKDGECISVYDKLEKIAKEGESLYV